MRPDSVPTRDQLLRWVPPWREAVAVEATAIAGGGNRTSYLVRVDRRLHVLQVSRPRPCGSAAPLADEYALLETLAAHELAPQPVWTDEEAGVLVTQYVEGQPWGHAALSVPGNLERLAATLARVHALEWKTPAADPLAATEAYLAGLPHERCWQRPAGALRRRIAPHAACAVTAPVLCHGDPLCSNIVDAGGLVLVDWEYAGAGDPWFDLALVVGYHDLSREQTATLLAAYRRASGRDVAAERFAALARLADALTLSWSLARAAAGLEEGAGITLGRDAARRLGLGADVAVLLGQGGAHRFGAASPSARRS
jgi:aminoglycoside phosphotransferase (APT) family kinase protein